MRHAFMALAVIGLATASAASEFDTAGIFVNPRVAGSVKAKHKWKTSGGGGDGSVAFEPDVVVSPDEFGAELSGSVTTAEPESSTEEFFVIVHAGKGSSDRPTRYRAKISRRDDGIGNSFSAVLSDMVYALDLSLPQSTGAVQKKKAIEAIDGAVDITSSKGLLDLRVRGPGAVDVKFKAKYKGTVIFGPRAGKKVKGAITLVAKAAARGT